MGRRDNLLYRRIKNNLDRYFLLQEVKLTPHALLRACTQGAASRGAEVLQRGVSLQGETRTHPLGRVTRAGIISTCLDVMCCEWHFFPERIHLLSKKMFIL